MVDKLIDLLLSQHAALDQNSADSLRFHSLASDG